MTFEKWLLKNYGLSLKSFKYVNEDSQAVLRARYADYLKELSEKDV